MTAVLESATLVSDIFFMKLVIIYSCNTYFRPSAHIIK